MSKITFGNGTTRKRVSDLHWLWNRRMAGRYTCPALLTLTVWFLRLRGKRVGWWLNSPEDRTFCGYMPKSRSHLVEVHCPFPHKWIRKECDFWNWINQRKYKLRQTRLRSKRL